VPGWQAPRIARRLKLLSWFAAVLWPLRRPVQEFDLNAIGTVNSLLGAEAKVILRAVQTMRSDDLETVAHALQFQLEQDLDFTAAAATLVARLNAEQIFRSHIQLRASTDGVPLVGGNSGVDPSPSVFISYARSDGEALATDLRQRLEAEEIRVWQDRVRMVGGRDWWLQITDALNEVDFMVLVATKGAMKSNIVQKEWRYARQQGVCICPVLTYSSINVEALPRWMRAVHFYDLEQEWLKLVQDLRTPCQTPRVPFMAEDLSDTVVDREAELEKLLAHFLDANRDPVSTTVALYGTGGYGKTTLARALCHHDDIRQAFDDGVLWVTLGESPET
jgi:hypothetical protein